MSFAILPVVMAVLALSSETAVSVDGGAAPLHGTLRTPDGVTRAAALFLPGSGPTDRNGDQPPIVAATTRLLAEGLAERGVASLRFDKRGIGESAAAAPPESELRFSANVADTRLWIAEAIARTGQPCVWLIGHSEGALVALATAAESREGVCGLVLLAGAGRPAGTVLREQLAPLPEPLKTQAYDALAELEAGRTVADPPAALMALLRPSVQPYLISWLMLDPAALLAAYDGPVMIGQGGADIQVSMADAEALHAARPDAALAVWDGVNHVLKTAPADRAGNIATYMDPSLPLAPGVVEDVARFILR